MTVATCSQTGCTVGDTGTCLLSFDNLSECPHAVLDGERPEPSAGGEESATPSADAAVEPVIGRRFHAGLELGTEDAAEVMRANYTDVVGILGASDAGKTCLLLSLYIMAAQGGLEPSFSFAGSRTLRGFELRARRLREWREAPLPEQLADHTILSDPRRPALLHLALRPLSDDAGALNLLLPDLPGEWTSNLIDRASGAERFGFLRRADRILLVLDGPILMGPSRHAEVQRARHLLDRLVEAVEVDTSVPLFLVVSKGDRIDLNRPEALDPIEAHAQSCGFAPMVAMTAAFSVDPTAVPHGTGVKDLFASHLPPAVRSPANPKTRGRSGRVFLNAHHFGADEY